VADSSGRALLDVALTEIAAVGEDPPGATEFLRQRRRMRRVRAAPAISGVLLVSRGVHLSTTLIRSFGNFR
jgi:hypothetical protein